MMIEKMYDPIGILNPSTVTARILIQEISKAGLNCEDELNEDMHNKWANYLKQLSSIKAIKIDRHYFGEHAKDLLPNLQLCFLNDESSKTYGSVYL